MQSTERHARQLRMAKRTASDVADYWRKRVRSPAFRRGVTKIVSRELRQLAHLRLGDVVDRAAVRRWIQAWDFDGLERDVIADVLLTGSRGLEQHLRRQHRSLLDVLGPELADGFDALLQTNVMPPAQVEKLITSLMEQEFVRGLLTELVFTAIAAFNRRVNPLFGAMATRMLEEQIKGFIGLFLPNLQRQAVAFATSAANQRVGLDFSRAILRQLLGARLSDYAGAIASGDQKAARVLLHKAMRSRSLDAAVRRAMLASLDAIYAYAAAKPIGDLVHAERAVTWLTARILDTIDFAAGNKEIRHFIADEIELALRPRP